MADIRWKALGPGAASMALASLTCLAHAERECTKCHERWPNKWVTCPMDGKPTRPVLGTVAKADTRAFDQAFGRGIAAYRGRDYSGAYRAFASSAKINRNSALSVYWMARCRWERGFVEDAFKIFVRAVDLNPEYGPPNSYIADLYAMRGNVVEAERLYGKAIRQGPDFARPHLGLGDLYLGRRPMSEDDAAIAEREYRKAVELASEDAVAHRKLGYFLWMRGREGAVAELERAVALDPRDKTARRLLEQAKKRRPAG